MSKLLVFSLVVIVFSGKASSSDELLSVIALYRHGDRAPIKSYRYDVYDESYWPEGYGQLTNIGKKQHYDLGRWFRNRYDGFLPKKYNREDIHVLSSNKDRCLMSAAANLAGLYPPEDDQVWNKNLLWQPIPIHTTPEREDAVLAQNKTCPKYDRLYEELMQTQMFHDIFRENSELFEYLSINSGESIRDFNQLKDLYNTLYVQDLYNLTLPMWTNEVFPDKLDSLCNFGWSTYTYTRELATLKTGPLIDHIATHFENIMNGMKGTPKFLMLSAHDSTIAYLLTTLKVYDYQWPPYASSVIFELKKGAAYNFVNIFYKNADNAAEITLPNCGFDCNYDAFMRVLQPVRISLEKWQEECLEG